MTDQPLYQWQRYWAPRNGTIPFGHDGFPLDPESKLGKLSGQALSTFAEISGIPCLALLGEPGIGKSEVLKSIKKSDGVADPTDKTPQLFLDLRSYSSEDRLFCNIFQSEEFNAWVNGTHTLEIVLDSLDECLIHCRTVAAMLVDELRKYPRSRLRLRIACRTGEWPVLLSEELPKLWTPDGYGAYELAPLLRADVVLALQLNDIPPDKFLDQLEHHNAIALASKPLTLKFLMSVWDGTTLPTSPVELYAKGCRELCREQNPNRQSVRSRSLDPDEALCLAERIAAMMILGKRAIISEDSSDDPEEISIIDLAGGEEHTSNRSVAATPENLAEVIQSTGLFTGRPKDRMGWSHWSFAEFLAAKYLVMRGFAPAQIRSLIMHPDQQINVVPRVVPQLREMVGWLCALDPNVLPVVIPGDPDILLRSAGVAVDNRSRQELVESLLHQAELGRSRIFDWFSRKNYSILGHPGLSIQLLPFIQDRLKDVSTREVAFEIAEFCKVLEVLPQITNCALDRNEIPRIRVAAADCIAGINEEAYILQLKPLLGLSKDEDPDDDLKGIALKALWPKYLSAKELFAFLSPQRMPNRYGAYSSFLHLRLRDTVSAQYVVDAVEWAMGLPQDHDLALSFQELISQIVDLALSHLDQPNVLTKLVDLLLLRLQKHQAPIPKGHNDDNRTPLEKDRKLRHRVIEALVPKLPFVKAPRTYFNVNLRGLIDNQDLDWLVDQVVGATEPELQERWLAALYIALDWSNSDQLDVMMRGVAQSPLLATTFKSSFEVVEIESPTGRKMKADYLRWTRMLRPRRGERPELTEPLNEIIRRRLTDAEAGDLDKWWQINVDLTVKPPIAHYHLEDEHQTDLTKLEGWKTLTPDDVTRCLRLAIKYLELKDPNTDAWLGTNIFYRPAVAGLKALQLVKTLAPEEFSQLPKDTWRKWASIVVAFSETSDDSVQLVPTAYAAAPDECILTLNAVMTKEDHDHGHIFAIRRMSDCWDERLSESIFSFIRTGGLKPQSVGNLLDKLLEHRPQDASEAVELLQSTFGSPENAREHTIIVAATILANSPNEGWSVLWERIKNDLDLGKKIFGRLSMSHHENRNALIATRITESEAADLYVWLAQQFPHDEDPKHEGTYSVTERDAVASFRDGVLRRLQERGSTAAYSAIKSIVSALPDIKWLKRVVPAAAEATMKESWKGQSPKAILALVRNRANRIIENGSQLLELITESLSRLEKKLHGVTPAAVDLWNESTATPKGENRISDYVKRHLEDDLRRHAIIANREVEIRDGVGAPGEETDILVQAISGTISEPKTIGVIVETKGCWNTGLKRAMKDQLIDRYLKENECRHGLFLVGWFRCSYWNRADYRLDATPKWSLAQAAEFFQKQAEDLSNEELRVRSFVLDATVRTSPEN